MTSTVKILIAKVGLDGHDRGAILLTKALKEEGFETYYSGLRRTPDEIAEMAVRFRADCVGLSSLSGAHMTWFPKVAAALKASPWPGKLIIAGGIIPTQDEPELHKAGISAVFHPHHRISEIADYIREQAKPLRFPPTRKIM